MTMYMLQMTWNISVINDHVYVTNDMEYLVKMTMYMSQMTMYMLQITWNIFVTNNHVYVTNDMEYLCHK